MKLTHTHLIGTMVALLVCTWSAQADLIGSDGTFDVNGGGTVIDVVPSAPGPVAGTALPAGDVWNTGTGSGSTSGLGGASEFGGVAAASFRSVEPAWRASRVKLGRTLSGSGGSDDLHDPRGSGVVPRDPDIDIYQPDIDEGGKGGPTDPVPVPAPGAAMLAVLGFGMIGLVRRNSRG